MKIAFVNNLFHLGGAETVMKQIQRGLRLHGHNGTIYLGENSEQALPAGVRFLYPSWLNRLWHTRFSSLVRRFAPRRQTRDRNLVKLARKHFDLIHIHNFHGLYASTSALAQLAHKVPTVWTFHRFWGVTGGCDHPGECVRYLDHCGSCPRVDEWPISGHDNTARQLEEKEHLLGSAPLIVVAPSKHLAEVVRRSKVGRNWRIEVIPNGVDPEEFKPLTGPTHALRQSYGLNPEKILIIAVNRSYRDPLKGGNIIADAISHLDFSRVQIALIGGETEVLQQQLPPSADVVFLGYVKDRARLATLLGLADIFLYASPRENFPCATLEAMASGCCVVSTPTDGVLEQIRDGQEGLFSEDFTGVSLSQTVNRIVSQPNKIAELGTAARKRVIDLFTEETMVQRHLELYQEIILQQPSLAPQRP